MKFNAIPTLNYPSLWMKIPTLTPILIIFLGALCLNAQAPDGYILDWADEFDYTGAPNPEYWTHEIGAGGWGNEEVQTYTDSLDNSRVENGNLIIEVHQIEDVGRTPTYTSARLITREKAQWKYGRMEMRAKVPYETGTWSAFWMLAADRLHGNAGWPDNGEIDIMEHIGYREDPDFLEIVGEGYPNLLGTLHTFLFNGLNTTAAPIGGSTYVPDLITGFHTYAVNWTEDLIEFEVDGVVYFSHELPNPRNPPEDFSTLWPFDQQFYIILNIAVGGNLGGIFNTSIYPTSPYPKGINHEGDWPQQMVVDYVRVYQRDIPPEATVIPGQILATDMDESDGILIYQAENIDVEHNLTFIDAGDSASFAIEAPQTGLYTISATTAAATGGKTMNIAIPETGALLDSVSVPNTSGWQAWQTTEIGTVELQQGVNTLRMTTETGGYNLATFDIAEAAGSIWKGLQVDAAGNAETNSWLGRININAAPWIYSYKLQNHLYMPVALEETFSTDNQWIYIPRQPL
jgi:beta-glucanase (GH16 family)